MGFSYPPLVADKIYIKWRFNYCQKRGYFYEAKQKNKWSRHKNSTPMKSAKKIRAVRKSGRVGMCGRTLKSTIAKTPSHQDCFLLLMIGAPHHRAKQRIGLRRQISACACHSPWRGELQEVIHVGAHDGYVIP